VYNSKVNRLTDIVRSSVDCSTFAAINDVVEVRSRLVVLCDLERRENYML
jgi:hypothetical protein